MQPAAQHRGQGPRRVLCESLMGIAWRLAVNTSFTARFTHLRTLTQAVWLHTVQTIPRSTKDNPVLAQLTTRGPSYAVRAIQAPLHGLELQSQRLDSACTRTRR